MLKLDFENAFDLIEDNTIFDILKTIGFGPTWIHWMEMIFISGIYVVPFSGVLGKNSTAK